MKDKCMMPFSFVLFENLVKQLITLLEVDVHHQCYRHYLLRLKTEMLITENTYLLCYGKYHCTSADLLFDSVGFDQCDQIGRFFWTLRNF